MAVTHYAFNPSTQSGARLRAALNQLETGRDALTRERDTMALDVDGDTSDATNYTAVKNRYGFESNADAKSAFDEINSSLGKINTDGSVTFVQTALNQLFSKLR